MLHTTATLPAQPITAFLTVPVNIHRFGAQNLKCVTQFATFNANKIPFLGNGECLICVLQIGCQEELPVKKTIYSQTPFPSLHLKKCNHQRQFKDMLHRNNSLSLLALCFYLFIFSVRITFLKRHMVFLRKQIYMWLLKGSLIMKKPIWSQTNKLTFWGSFWILLPLQQQSLRASCRRLESIMLFSIQDEAGMLPTEAQRLLNYHENGICHMCLHHLVFHNLPERSG